MASGESFLEVLMGSWDILYTSSGISGGKRPLEKGT